MPEIQALQRQGRNVMNMDSHRTTEQDLVERKRQTKTIIPNQKNNTGIKIQFKYKNSANFVRKI